MAVINVMRELELPFASISLGEIDFGENHVERLTPGILVLLEEKLKTIGFDLLGTKKSQLVEKIKVLCIEYVQCRNDHSATKLSAFLAKSLIHDYKYLSQLFSSVEGVTIEQFYIRQRIEKVKELLVYDELSLSEIAYQLEYSSVAHLSGQFKKVTGLTPSHFRSLKDMRQRTSLDEI